MVADADVHETNETFVNAEVSALNAVSKNAQVPAEFDVSKNAQAFVESATPKNAQVTVNDMAAEETFHIEGDYVSDDTAQQDGGAASADSDARLRRAMLQNYRKIKQRISATVELLLELNKTLRFGKSCSDYKINMTPVCSGVDDLCFLCFSDAAFNVRSDGSSQGGYVIVVTSKRALKGEQVAYNLLTWRSFKLNRVCRSSLSAESQACATALDELMMIKSMVALMFDPTKDPLLPQTAADCGESAIIIDAKALYDSLKKDGIGSAADKRAGIEILCIKEEIQRLKTWLRWGKMTKSIIATHQTQIKDLREQLADARERLQVQTEENERLINDFDRRVSQARRDVLQWDRQRLRLHAGPYHFTPRGRKVHLFQTCHTLQQSPEVLSREGICAYCWGQMVNETAGELDVPEDETQEAT
eukprot:s4775_g4.t1